jgi:hypothetical protein
MIRGSHGRVYTMILLQSRRCYGTVLAVFDCIVSLAAELLSFGIILPFNGLHMPSTLLPCSGQDWCEISRPLVAHDLLEGHF